MSGNVGKLTSLLSGLTAGGIFGVYLAQNYVVPDVRQLLSLIRDKAEQYTKESCEENNRDE